MDPLIALLTVVVGLNIIIVYLLWQRHVHVHNETITTVSVTDAHPTHHCIITTETQTNRADYAKIPTQDIGVQTEDTEYFMAFYDHVTAQHQEILESKADFDHLVFNFDNNVARLAEYINLNFRGLTGQLHFQLNSILHATLHDQHPGIHVGPVPPLPPLDSVCPPPLHPTWLHADNWFEAQECFREEQGIRSMNPHHLWSFLPFGRRTRSPAAYAKHRAKQIDIRDQKRQLEYQQNVAIAEEAEAYESQDFDQETSILKQYPQDILDQVPTHDMDKIITPLPEDSTVETDHITTPHEVGQNFILSESPDPPQISDRPQTPFGRGVLICLPTLAPASPLTSTSGPSFGRGFG